MMPSLSIRKVARFPKPCSSLNTCYNLLDVHVEHGRAEQVALIYDSPVTGVVKSYTYRELL